MADQTVDHTVIGQVVGYGPGIIYVETEAGEVIILDRFSAMTPLANGKTIFKLPQDLLRPAPRL